MESQYYDLIEENKQLKQENENLKRDLDYMLAFIAAHSELVFAYEQVKGGKI